MKKPQPYVRAEKVARETGVTVRVLDLFSDETEFEPPTTVLSRDLHGNPVTVRRTRWATVCDSHQAIAHYETFDEAAEWAVEPSGWCDACKEQVAVAG